MNRRDFLAQGTAFATAAVVTPAANAQSKPLTIYVGYPAGGSPDQVARTIAVRLGELLRTPVVVENRPGAGGALAMEAVKNGPKDGAALVLTPSPPVVLNPFVYPKLQYKVTDFVPVGQAVTFDLALAVPATHPAKDLKQFIEWIKMNPKTASFGVPGLGSTPHFLGYLIGKAASAEYQVVGYRGGPQLMSDLLGAQIPSAISVLSNFVPDHRAGKLRVLATAGSHRSTLLPEVPTLAEFFNTPQLKDVVTLTEWYAFFAPAGTPQSVLAHIYGALEQVLSDKSIREALTAQGHDPAPQPASTLSETITRQQSRWRAIVKESGFKLES